MTLDKLVELALAHAGRVLIGTRDEVLPIFMLVDRNDRAAVVEAPAVVCGTEQEKEAFAAEMKLVMRLHGVKQYALLSNARMVVHESDSTDRPSAQPDRIEVVAILASDGNETKYQIWHILRNEGGICTGLEEQDTEGVWMHFDGQWAGLLAPTAPRQ